MKRPAATGNQTRDNWPGLCSQWSATELQQLNNHAPQFSICTAQVSLKCFSHTPRRHYVCAVRTLLKRWLEISLTVIWLHKPGVLGSIPGNCCMAFSLASIFTSKENCDTILSTHFVMKMAKFDLDSNTNSPRA